MFAVSWFALLNVVVLTVMPGFENDTVAPFSNVSPVILMFLVGRALITQVRVRGRDFGGFGADVHTAVAEERDGRLRREGLRDDSERVHDRVRGERVVDLGRGRVDRSAERARHCRCSPRTSIVFVSDLSCQSTRPLYWPGRDTGEVDLRRRR